MTDEVHCNHFFELSSYELHKLGTQDFVVYSCMYGFHYEKDQLSYMKIMILWLRMLNQNQSRVPIPN